MKGTVSKFLYFNASENRSNSIGHEGAKFVGEAIAKCINLNSLDLNF